MNVGMITTMIMIMRIVVNKDNYDTGRWIHLSLLRR